MSKGLQKVLTYAAILAFVSAFVLVVGVFSGFFDIKAEDCPAPVTCPAPEPCTLQKCTCLAGMSEFLGNYFLCEGSENLELLEYCYNSEKALCLDRCVLFLINPVNQSRLSIGTDETEKLRACEDVCQNQLDVYKATKAFKMKQCEWEVSDPYTRRKVAIMEENIRQLDVLEDVEYEKVVTYKGKKCYRSFVTDTPYDCLVCVGDVWENVTSFEIYDELNADPFKPRVRPLQVKILDVKEGWVKFKRTYGDPRNKNVTSFSIGETLCPNFQKLEK